ncbi:MAG: SLC13 family permease [Candidatus Saccharibacteria bacterium]
MGEKPLVRTAIYTIQTNTKENVVLVIAALAALASSLFIKPSREYLNYFDYRTLTCLFCMLAVICALNNIHFFEILSRKIVSVFKTTRASILALVYITLLGSMLITNDMALLIFLPLAYFVLNSTGQRKHIMFTFIMQNFAANLGGMLTPFGNPQNLYLYSFFNIDSFEFIRIMLVPFVLSIVLITACCLFVKPEPLLLVDELDNDLDIKKTVIYLALFIFSISIVLRGIPFFYGLLVITCALLILDIKALKDVDYALLLTFCAFFVFSGNVSRLPFVSHFFASFMHQNTLLTGIVSSQLISNVPSAVLLSQFTTNYRDLLIAVNIGGVGTLVASLASLITLKEFNRHYPGRQWSFIKRFSIYNFGFLAALTLLCSLG